MKIWPRTTADHAAADHAARDTFERIICGHIAACDAAAIRDAEQAAAGDAKAELEPVAPTLPQHDNHVLSQHDNHVLSQHDNHVLSRHAFREAEARELAHLISGAPRPGQKNKVNATAEFCAFYGSDSIMRTFATW